MATLAHVVPEGEQWAYEIKHDGYRMISCRYVGRVRIFSRNALDWTDRVPAIVEAMRALPASAVVFWEGPQSPVPACIFCCLRLRSG